MEGGDQVQRSAACSKYVLQEDLLVNSGGEGTGADVNVLMCRICFAEGCKLYLMTSNKILYQAYETLTGLMLENEMNLPQYLCSACSSQLLKCIHFRTRILQSHVILLEVSRKHDYITLESIQSIIGDHNSLSKHPSRNGIDQDDFDRELLEESNINNNQQALTEYDLDGNIFVDGIKVEYVDVMSPDVPFGDKNVDGVDISSLQDDITVEAMKAEHDDVPLETDTSNGDSGIKAEIDDEFNDYNTGEDFECYDNTHGKIFAGKELSQDASGPVEQVRRQEKLLTRVQKAARKKENLDRKESSTCRMRRADGQLVTEEILSCDVCPYEAVSAVQLVNHLKAHAGTYHCEKCNYKTTNQKHLAKHRKIHSGEKPYSCDVCKNKFSLKSNLRIHFRIHTGEKPYSCNVCNKKFRRMDHLKSHLRVHSGEKPYSCDVCNKTFATNSIMRQHKQLHIGEKSFSCEVCNKAFNRKCNLESHYRTHSGEKPYSCDICNEKFSFRCNLRFHLRKQCNENT